MSRFYHDFGQRTSFTWKELGSDLGAVKMPILSVVSGHVGAILTDVALIQMNYRYCRHARKLGLFGIADLLKNLSDARVIS